jgi:hypothetical protein
MIYSALVRLEAIELEPRLQLILYTPEISSIPSTIIFRELLALSLIIDEES